MLSKQGLYPINKSNLYIFSASLLFLLKKTFYWIFLWFYHVSCYLRQQLAVVTRNRWVTYSAYDTDNNLNILMMTKVLVGPKEKLFNFQCKWEEFSNIGPSTWQLMWNLGLRICASSLRRYFKSNDIYINKVFHLFYTNAIIISSSSQV